MFYYDIMSGNRSKHIWTISTKPRSHNLGLKEQEIKKIFVYDVYVHPLHEAWANCLENSDLERDRHTSVYVWWGVSQY